MAETAGTPTARDVLDYLVKEGPKVAFFQALLLLERSRPGSVQIGHDGPPDRELVRVRPSLALSCPPADLESIEPLGLDGLRITATFLGLYGVDSPLPYAFAEHLACIADERSGQRIRDFLDIFHHRIYSLLYRGWKKSRPVSAMPGSVDPIYERVLSLIGHAASLGLGGARPPRLREARLRVLRARTAAGLQTLLRQRIDTPSRVEQLEPRTVEVPVEQRTRVGQHNSVLGESLLVGRRIHDRNKIGIKLQARRFAEFEELLPEGVDRSEVDEAVAGYLRDPIDYEVELTLPTPEVPPWRIGQRGKIGRSVWLGIPRPYAVCRWSGWKGSVRRVSFGAARG